MTKIKKLITEEENYKILWCKKRLLLFTGIFILMVGVWILQFPGNTFNFLFISSMGLICIFLGVWGFEYIKK